MRRDGGASSRATVVAVALVAAAAAIAVVAYLAAHLASDRKRASVAPARTAIETGPAPLALQRPSAVALLVFESGSAELPVDALTQAAVVLAAADQAPLSVRSFHDDDRKGNAAALAAARARAVVELLELAGVPPARIDLLASEPRAAGKDGRQTDSVEVSAR